MSGKYLLDSTILIDLFTGREEALRLREALDEVERYTSVICRIEVASFSSLSRQDEELISRFLGDFTVVPLNEEVEQGLIVFRRSTKLNIPNAIIAATALAVGAVVVSRDRDLLELPWPGLEVVSSL
jgi:predicted nucleic acid-binding protein